MNVLMRLGSDLVKAVVIGLVVVVTPLLAFSESTLRSIIDRWLTQCVVVIEIQGERGDSPLVRLHMFGQMPASLPITFSSQRGLIERVSFLNHVEQDSAEDKTNLLVHQLANERCPGSLCPQTYDPGEKLTLRVPTLSSQYLYQFRVVFLDKANPEDLRVYVQPRSSDRMDCRVESAASANFFARQSRAMQVLLLFIFVVILTLLASNLKRAKGVRNEP